MRSLLARASNISGGLLCALGLSFLPVGWAAAAQLQILAGYAIAAPLHELAAQFERTSGDKLYFRFGTAPQLVELIRDSRSFDLVIVPSDVLRNPAARARLAPGPAVELAHIWLAVAVRAGSPKPDISTPESFRRALLQARSIATLPASATGTRIMQTFQQLGIMDSVRSKIRAESTPAQVVEAVASGRAELGLFLSNVLTAPGLQVIGPFPDGLQQQIVFTSGVAAHASPPRVAEAEAFLHYLQSPAAAVVFRAHGITPGE